MVVELHPFIRNSRKTKSHKNKKTNFVLPDMWLLLWFIAGVRVSVNHYVLLCVKACGYGLDGR